MAAFLDVCRFVPNAGGTTDWTYSSTVTGYQSPAAAGAVNGELYKYRAESSNLAQWEIGEGVYSSGSNTIARTTVLYNSSGTTAKINFTVAPQVAVVALKSDLLAIDESNTFSASQRSQARANLDVLKKNYIVNPAMMISQENGTTSGTTSLFYPVDKWLYGVSGTTGQCTAAQVASLTPGGSPNRIRVTVTTADAAVATTDLVYLRTAVEGINIADLRFGSATAKTVILQFGVKAPAGTYSVAIRNGATNRTYVAEFTITGGEANVDVVKSVTVGGDQSGTWAIDSTVGLEVLFGLMGGSSFFGTVGSWAAASAPISTNQFNLLGTLSNIFELFDVSLSEGIAAPPFIVPDFATELVKCQREYEKSTFNYQSVSGATLNRAFQVNTPFKVSKRAVPTMSLSSTTLTRTTSLSTTSTTTEKFGITFSNTDNTGDDFNVSTTWAASAKL